MIVIYGSGPGWVANGVERNAQQSSHYRNPDNDPRGPWFDGNPLGSPNPRENLMYDVLSPAGISIRHPPNGWRWQKSTMVRMISEGSIRFNADGTRIVYRTYVKEQGALPPSNLWGSVEETGSNRKAKNELKAMFGLPAREVFSTPKPERLLERVIHIASNPGDIIVDVFAGSGTTAAVAHKMGRRWVTAELSENTADAFTAPRLTKVVNGEDPGGITASAGWTGGGGFRQLRVAPSTWQVEDGDAYLVDGVDPGILSRAVAAQLGYTPVEHAVFAGRKGRSMLAVLHGVADAVAVQDVVAALDEGETAVVAALAIADGAASLLRDLRPGSRLVRITTDLFPARTSVIR